MVRMVLHRKGLSVMVLQNVVNALANIMTIEKSKRVALL